MSTFFNFTAKPSLACLLISSLMSFHLIKIIHSRSLSLILPVLFFGIYFIVGWNLLPDYGVSWDEFKQRTYGLYTFDYISKVLHLDTKLYMEGVNLETAGGRQYPVIFSLTAAILERLLNIDEQDYYKQVLFRHQMLFFVFWTACVYFYKLLHFRLKSVVIALSGTMVLILTPRIFAHSFFNTKDIVLLSFYIVSIYGIVRYMELPNFRRAIFLGLSCALVVNARTAGIIVPVAGLLFSFIAIFYFWSDKRKRNALTLSLLAFILTFGVFAILFFPYLWSGIVQNSSKAFLMAAHFPKQFKILFFNQYLASSPTPFYYPYAWMLVSIPVGYLILMIAGILFFFKGFFVNIGKLRLWNSFNELTDLALFVFFAGPLFAVWYFESTLYDGWRHLYFIYPPVLGLGMVALQQILQSKFKPIKYITIILLTITCANTTFFMIKNHPHQQVYFNTFAGKNRTASFEMDYWGVSYKQAFEELVHRDICLDLIHVFCANQPCIDNYFALPEEIQSRIKMRWGIEVADYYLSNYRFPSELNNFLNKTFPFEKEYFSIDVDGEKILGVYVLPRD